ncbi:MAG: DoxX family protein [Mucilaginibacter sp.]|uniref:DoxX family protein n=1 Tax=Mucilaginibacter sp. TaxID=1882438 RepID=UPI0031AD3CC9
MNTFIERITQTNKSIAPLLLRLTLALVLFPHGAQLLAGWFGGYGYSASMQYFTSQGLSSFIAFMVIFLEFFGSLFILFGVLTRPFAIALLVLFLGMISTVHYSFGFFMNWFGSQKGEGYEFHLLAIGLLLTLTICGGGVASADRLINKLVNNNNNQND